MNRKQYGKRKKSGKRKMKLLDDDYQEDLAQRIAEGIFNEIKGGKNL